MFVQFLTHATTSLYFCSSVSNELFIVIFNSSTRWAQRIGEIGGTLNRVVLSSTISGGLGTSDMADVTTEKLLRQAKENYTWRSIVHTGHVRAYMSMLAQNTHVLPWTQEGKTKAVSTTQYIHVYSLSDNAFPQTLSVIVPRLRLLSADCNEKTHKTSGRQNDGNTGSCPIDSPPGRASLRPTVRNQLGQT